MTERSPQRRLRRAGGGDTGDVNEAYAKLLHHPTVGMLRTSLRARDQGVEAAGVMRQEGPHRLLVRGYVQRAGGDRVQALEAVAGWIATLIASDETDTLFMMGSEFGVRSRDLLSTDERSTAITENVDPGANPIFSAAMADEMRVALTEAITRVVDEEIERYSREN